MTSVTSQAQDRATKIIMAPSFEEAVKGTDLEDENQLKALMLLLAEHPLIGRASQLHQEIRTLEFAGSRVFYLPADKSIYLLSVDSGGPEKAPSANAKRAVSRVVSSLATAGIQHLIKWMVQTLR